MHYAVGRNRKMDFYVNRACHCGTAIEDFKNVTQLNGAPFGKFNRVVVRPMIFANVNG